MANVLTISGSALWSLGLGSDFKTTYLHIGIETGSAFTGSITVLKRIAGQPTPKVPFYTDWATGNWVQTPVTASVQIVLENSQAEIILSSSIVNSSASVYYGVNSSD